MSEIELALSAIKCLMIISHYKEPGMLMIRIVYSELRDIKGMIDVDALQVSP